MTRTLNMARGADKRQRRRGIEPAVVERAARDGTGELARPRLQQRLHIVDRRETARRNHRNGDAVGERDGGVEIEALEQAVAGNIGVDDRGDAGVGKAARHVVGRKLGRFRPAGDRDPAVARVEPDRDPAGIALRRALHERRVAHRRGADDDAPHAFGEPRLDGRHIADAAAELHRDIHDGQDALDRAGVHRLAGECAVEIDHVQILESLRRKCGGLRGRIAVKHRRTRHVALFEPHRESVFEIDGRE